MKIKKFVPFLIAIPVFIIIIAFIICPAIISVLLSFMDFTTKGGLFNSDYIGLKNYTELLNNVYIGRLIKNSFVNVALPLLTTCVLAFFLAICINKLSNKWFKCAALSIIAIPAFIPITAFVGLIIGAVSTDGFVTELFSGLGIYQGNPLAKPATYIGVYTAASTLRNLFVPVTLGVLICEKNDKLKFKNLLLGIAGYALIRLTLMTQTDELSLLLYNPLVYEKADTFGTFIYRKGLQESGISYSSAAWTIKTAVMLVLNIVIYFILKGLSNKVTLPESLSSKALRPSSFAGLIGFLILAACSIVCLICVLNPFSVFGEKASFAAFGFNKAIYW